MNRFIRDVCQKLNEPKQHLMRKVLQQTGKVFVLDLVQQTEKVEEEGGQFVADGTRRRTKGGVFLNLLKSQVTKEQWDTIFEDEKEAQVSHALSSSGIPVRFLTPPPSFPSV